MSIYTFVLLVVHLHRLYHALFYLLIPNRPFKIYHFWTVISSFIKNKKEYQSYLKDLLNLEYPIQINEEIAEDLNNFFIYKEKVPFISADVDTSKLKEISYRYFHNSLSCLIRLIIDSVIPFIFEL